MRVPESVATMSSVARVSAEISAVTVTVGGQVEGNINASTQVKLLQSGADTGAKILWALLIILLPVLGMVLYFLMGPGRGKAV